METQAWRKAQGGIRKGHACFSQTCVWVQSGLSFWGSEALFLSSQSTRREASGGSCCGSTWKILANNQPISPSWAHVPCAFPPLQCMVRDVCPFQAQTTLPSGPLQKLRNKRHTRQKNPGPSAAIYRERLLPTVCRWETTSMALEP